MPFGWYEPGNAESRTTIATLAEQTDPNTNDKSRMLEPPLASGSVTFEPSLAQFGIWMLPAGVGLLASEDAVLLRCSASRASLGAARRAWGARARQFSDRRRRSKKRRLPGLRARARQRDSVTLTVDSHGPADTGQPAASQASSAILSTDAPFWLPS